MSLKPYIYGTGMGLFYIAIYYMLGVPPSFLVTLVILVCNVGYGIYMCKPVVSIFVILADHKDQSDVLLPPVLEEAYADTILINLSDELAFVLGVTVLCIIGGLFYPVFNIVCITSSWVFAFLAVTMYEYWCRAYLEKIRKLAK